MDLPQFGTFVQDSGTSTIQEPIREHLVGFGVSLESVAVYLVRSEKVLRFGLWVGFEFGIWVPKFLQNAELRVRKLVNGEAVFRVWHLTRYATRAGTTP